MGQFLKKIFSQSIVSYRDMNVAVKASLWFTFCSILQRGISVITMPIFTRIMSTESFGDYTIFHTWYNIFVIIVTLNINSEIFNKGLIQNSDCKDRYTSNQAVLLVVLSLGFLTIYLPFHKTINGLIGLSDELFFIMILEILGNGLVILWSTRQRFEYKYRNIVLVTIITSLLSPALGIIAVLIFNDQAMARICANSFVYTATGFILLLSILKKSHYRINFSWWKSSLLLSLPLIPHYLSLVLLNQSDKLMINYFIGSEKAAIYSVAHSAGLLMTIVNNSINASFVPWAYGKLKNEDGKGIKNISNYLYAIIVCVNTLLIWFAPEAIHLLAAPQYAEAVWCLVPIASSVFFFFVYTLFVDVEIYYGGTKYVALASIIAASLNLVLNYIFIPAYGFIAAGYTTLVSYIATMCLHFLFMKIILKKNKVATKLFDLRIILLFSVLMIGLSTMAMVLYKWLWVRLLFAVILLIVVYWKRKDVMHLFKSMKKH